jgi:hypothetical protein
MVPLEHAPATVISTDRVHVLSARQHSAGTQDRIRFLG